MARIFISYSRIDTAFVERLYLRLQQMRPNFHIWYDQAPHGLLGGDSWWDAIMQAIAESDIFIYVLSNESVQSKYCQAEFAEARRLQKRIITIQARDRTKLPGELGDIQYVDMKNGVDDPDALARLSGALERQTAQIRRHRPLWQPRTPKPIDDSVPTRSADSPDIDTPTLRLPTVERRATSSAPWWKTPTFMIAALVLVIAFVIVVLLNGIGGNGDNEDTPSPTTTSAEVGIAGTATETPGESSQPTDLPSNTPAPTGTPTPTETPLDIADLVQTLDAQATIEQATLNVQATAAARATEYAVGTQNSIDQTATATLWTPTPTPNITASIDAYRTQQAATITQAWIESSTDTPTATWTPTDTLTPTQTPTHTPSLTPDPLEAVLDLAKNFSGTRNTDWKPFIQAFDGVEMVLVPAGCFEMGSTDEEIAAQVTALGGDLPENQGPKHKVCFDEPFWIDRYEVTNGQFAQFNGEAATTSEFSGDNRPREQIAWEEASAYCASRDARLPTEAEWEYAARGPDALVYPWGNEWNSDNAVWVGNSNDETAEVGSKPGGASWVGALDLSGNVWEWVADWYDEDYYGTLADGTVNPSSPTSGTSHVLRGGSWYYPVTAFFRASFRPNWYPVGGSHEIGFRCARSR